MIKAIVSLGCAVGALIVLAGCPQSPDSASSIGRPFPFLEKGRAVQATTDGGFIIMGDVIRPPQFNGQERLFLSKRNEDGSSEWSRDFSHWGSLQGFMGMDGSAVKETSEGGFVVAGVLETELRTWGGVIDKSIASEAPYRAFLLRVNSSGQETWRRTYGDAQTITSWANDVVPMPDGGFAMAYTDYQAEAGSQSWIQKTDADGNATWKLQAPVGGTSQTVAALQDGGCVLGGSFEHPEPLGTVLLLKAGANGETAWSHTYSALQAERYLPRLSVRELSDGSLLLAGATLDEGGFFLLKTDANGIETGRFVLTEPLPFRFHSIVATGDGGCVLGAEDDTAEGSEPFTIKIGPQGQVEWSTALNPLGAMLGWTTCVQPWDGGRYLTVITTALPADEDSPFPSAGLYDLNIEAFSLGATGAVTPWPSL